MGRGLRDKGLLTITMADDFSSTSFQPAFKFRPSTWHCSDTLFPTSTETLDTWTFNVGNSGGQGCQKACESREWFQPPTQQWPTAQRH